VGAVAEREQKPKRRQKMFGVLVLVASSMFDERGVYKSFTAGKSIRCLYKHSLVYWWQRCGLATTRIGRCKTRANIAHRSGHETKWKK
jgi:hypothetical protein